MRKRIVMQIPCKHGVLCKAHNHKNTIVTHIFPRIVCEHVGFASFLTRWVHNRQTMKLVHMHVYITCRLPIGTLGFEHACVHLIMLSFFVFEIQHLTDWHGCHLCICNCQMGSPLLLLTRLSQANPSHTCCHHCVWKLMSPNPIVDSVF